MTWQQQMHDQNIRWLINLRSVQFEAELTMKMKTRKEKVLTWDRPLKFGQTKTASYSFKIK